MAEFDERWGKVVATGGFAQIPQDLIHINDRLPAGNKLSAIELLVLVQLVAAWWYRDTLPYPSMATLAGRCGVSERQVQRTIKVLEVRAFLTPINRRRRGRKTSNAYDLDMLVTRLTQLARQSPREFPRKVRGGPSDTSDDVDINHRSGAQHSSAAPGVSRSFSHPRRGR